MNPMMNHIADHLQFLALLTVRLSARKITEGDEHSFSSSPALSSNQDSEKGSTWNGESEYVEGDASMEKDEHEFLAEILPDLECPEDEWVESHLRNLGQEAEINYRPPNLLCWAQGNMNYEGQYFCFDWYRNIDQIGQSCLELDLLLDTLCSFV